MWFRWRFFYLVFSWKFNIYHKNNFSLVLICFYSKSIFPWFQNWYTSLKAWGYGEAINHSWRAYISPLGKWVLFSLQVTQYWNFEVITSHVNGLTEGFVPYQMLKKAVWMIIVWRLKITFWACFTGIQQDILTDPKAATQTSDTNTHILAADLDRQRGCCSQARDF